MVNDLFASHQRAPSMNRRGGSTASGGGGGGSSAADRALFTSVVEQVQKNIASSLQTPAAMRVLASYYTRRTPVIDGLPFCVALADLTFLYHMRMTRVPLTDVDLYAQLIMDVVAQLPSSEQLVHPFMTLVLRDCVLGLPSATSIKAHSVVLLSPHIILAWDHLVTTLLLHNTIPDEWVSQFHEQLRVFSHAGSLLVSERATAMLVRTLHNVSYMDQVRELQTVLRAKKNTLDIGMILTCYERLKRVCPDVERAALNERGLAIYCSEIFLKHRSPVRRDYVERYLYPALCSDDMRPYVHVPKTLELLTRRLLRLCVPGMSTTNAFYKCLCALVHQEMSHEETAALEMLRVMRCQMPYAAFFIGTLAIDTNMSLSTFGKSMLVLARASGFTLKGWSEHGDAVAQDMNNNLMDVYNVLFTLREIVRYSSCGATKRADDMLAASKVALPEKSIEALGKLADAFNGQYGVVLEPSLLCAELGMVIHDLNLEEAVDASLLHLTEASQFCAHCSGAKSSAPVCPVLGVPHLETAAAARRLLATIAECAGSKVLQKKLISLFREPDMQHNASLHQLTLHIITHAGQHQLPLFRALEPYIRNTLMTILAADQNTPDYDNSGSLSIKKANIMHFNVKLAVLLSTVIDATYVKAILKTFADMQLRSNHDSLVLWRLCNFMLRNGRTNVELMPLDPQECNYGDGFPACAPANHVAAENGQMLLELLDRVLHSSAEMAKLRGCTVCRLIQDFSPQTANIVSRLLGPCGFVPVGMSDLNRLALPVGSESTFWSFVMKQMRSSAPTRTALIATLARSIAMRFRVQSPAEAVAVEGGESTGHVFAVLMYEAMRRNATLARTVMHMMSTWVKQKKNMMPGKYTCLVYCCIQLATAVMLRHEFTDEIEAATEPASERQLFDEAVIQTTECILAQLPRVEKLLPEVSHNAPFAFLLKKIHLRARLLISEVEQQPVRPSAFDDEVNDAARRSTGEPLAHTVDIRDLQNADDNDVFSHMEGDHDMADQFGEDDWDNNDGPEDNDDEGHHMKLHLSSKSSRVQASFAHHGLEQSGLSGDESDGGNSLGSRGYSNNISASSRRGGPTATFTSGHHNHNLYHNQGALPSQGILVNRSAASSIGPSVSMRPAAQPSLPHVESRGTSVARSTQTAREVATNTSLPSSDDATPAVDAPGSAKQKKGQYFFKNTPHHHAHQQPPHTSTIGDQRAARSRSGVSSGASSNFLRRVPQDEHEHHYQQHQIVQQQHQHQHQPQGTYAHPMQQYAPHPHAGFIPSSSATMMQLFALQGGADSLLDDIGTAGAQGRQTRQFLEEQAAQFPMGGIENINRYHAPHHVYHAPPQHAMAQVAMEPRTNNYSEPHAAHGALPQATVVAHLTMHEVRSHPTSRMRDDSAHHNQQEDTSSKRRRLEEHQQHQQHPNMAFPPAAAPLMSAETAQRLMQLQFSRGPSSTHTGVDTAEPPQVQTYSDAVDNERMRATPHPHQIDRDLMTPHASRLIPAELVEQQAASTLREIMGGRGTSTNVQMGGSSAKRRFTSQVFDGSENDWYRLTAGAPMPSYASDGRYNMENF